MSAHDQDSVELRADTIAAHYARAVDALRAIKLMTSSDDLDDLFESLEQDVMMPEPDDIEPLGGTVVPVDLLTGTCAHCGRSIERRLIGSVTRPEATRWQPAENSTLDCPEHPNRYCEPS